VCCKSKFHPRSCTRCRCTALAATPSDIFAQTNQIIRAEKRFKEFEDAAAQTNEQYQRQVQPIVCVIALRCAVVTLLQMFSLREHLLAVEKQRDAKAQEASAWAARSQELQDDCNTQLSYQQIEIQVPAFAAVLAPCSSLTASRLQALHQRCHLLEKELQVHTCVAALAAAALTPSCRKH
jgi:hypothetical protein